MAIFGEEDWFTGSGFKKEILRINTGEESDGIEVVATDPPWTATLKYRGGQYDVPLFKRSADLFLAEPVDPTPPPGLIEEPHASTGESKPDDEKSAQPALTQPKSSLDPAEEMDMPTSATGNASSSGSGADPRETTPEGSEKSSAGVP